MKSPLTTDELIALAILLVSLLFSRYPIASAPAGIAVIYLFICVFFRKYEDAKRRLNKK